MDINFNAFDYTFLCAPTHILLTVLQRSHDRVICSLILIKIIIINNYA